MAESDFVVRQRFFQFLEKHVCKGGEFHFQMFGVFTKYHICKEELCLFFELYCLYLERVERSEFRHESPHLIENKKELEHVLFHLDFDILQDCKERIYDDDILKCLLKFICELLKKHLKDVLDEELEMAILCKGVQVREKGFGDGFHIQSRMIRVGKRFLRKIRDELVEPFSRIFPSLHLIKTSEEVVDVSIEHCNWFLYGSNKGKRKCGGDLNHLSYRIYKLFRYDTCELVDDTSDLKRRVLDYSMWYTHFFRDVKIFQEVEQVPQKRSYTRMVLESEADFEPEAMIVDDSTEQRVSENVPQKLTELLKNANLMKTDMEFSIGSEIKTDKKGVNWINFYISGAKCLANLDTNHSKPKHSSLNVSLNRVKISCFNSNHHVRVVPDDIADEIKKLVFGVVAFESDDEFKVTKQMKSNSFCTAKETREKIEKKISETNCKMLNDWIYVPKHCDYYYAKWVDSAEFISLTVPVMEQEIVVLQTATSLVKGRKNHLIPKLVLDKDLICFQDGIVVLSEKCAFYEYSDISEKYYDRFQDKCARSFVDCKFVGAEECVCFETILRKQFTEAEIEFFKICVGRLFFDVGKHDKWNFTVMFYGESMTGKSVLLDLILSFFEPAQVGKILPKTEKTFGFQGFENIELLCCHEMFPHFHEVLNQREWQEMCEGNRMTLPRKGTSAIEMTWSAPMIFVGNIFPNYDCEYFVERRLLVFPFLNRLNVSDVNPNLLQMMKEKERGFILKQCVCKYLECVEQNGTKGVVYAFCPESLKRGIQLFKAHKMDDFERFLHDPCKEDGSNRYRFEFGAAFSCQVAELKKVFELCMRQQRNYLKCPDNYLNHLKPFNCEIVTERLCLHCYQRAFHNLSTHEKCCPNYDNERRFKCQMIKGLRIITSPSQIVFHR